MAWMRATAMIIRTVCTRKDTKRVPRRREPTVRMEMEKIIAPVKKEVIETRDLSQPHGLLVGWLDAPRPRKMVLPVHTI